HGRGHLYAAARALRRSARSRRHAEHPTGPTLSDAGTDARTAVRAGAVPANAPDQGRLARAAEGHAAAGTTRAGLEGARREGASAAGDLDCPLRVFTGR